MAPDIFIPTFGDALRAVRRGRGLSQSEVGEMMGVSNATISNWETGATHYVNKDTRRELAVQLGQRPDYFEGMLFGNQFADNKSEAEDYSRELIEVAQKLTKPRVDPTNLVTHAESDHRTSSPHNGITPSGIVAIYGVENEPDDVRYAVRTIQLIYNQWLYNPHKTNSHWWIYLAEVLLNVMTVEDLTRLRDIVPEIMKDAPPRAPELARRDVVRADDV